MVVSLKHSTVPESVVVIFFPGCPPEVADVVIQLISVAMGNFWFALRIRYKSFGHQHVNRRRLFVYGDSQIPALAQMGFEFVRTRPPGAGPRHSKDATVFRDSHCIAPNRYAHDHSAALAGSQLCAIATNSARFSSGISDTFG